MAQLVMLQLQILFVVHLDEWWCMCRYKAIICSRTNKVELYRKGKCIGVTVAVENPKDIRKKIKKVIERMLARKR